MREVNNPHYVISHDKVFTMCGDKVKSEGKYS